MIRVEHITTDLERHIIPVRGLRVMLDEDLARIYGVSTKRLNQQVRRNIHRFPRGFLIELTPDEAWSMRSQFVTASRRNFQYRPFAFTEHGAIMLATVLNTPVAVEASVRVVQAFVKMRELLSTHAQLQKKMDELEQRVGTHDGQLQELFDAIRQLITPASRPRRKIGFKPS
ncbi:MAG: ORF6N domain-containing protein [Elusimicrobia bacterium]|nr:ORF6N domain-containing protein [Elusimicrobiota bacterium]